MKSLPIILMLLILGDSSSSDKWLCGDEAKALNEKQVTWIKPQELKKRVVSCAIPSIPLKNFDGKGTILVDVLIDENGNVECVRARNGHPILQLAAIKAAKQYKFKPLIVDGKAKRYAGILLSNVSWDIEEMEKQCPKERRA